MSTEVRHTDPKTGGQKGIKAERFDLIPFDALEELARVYGAGAKKYSDDNWRKGYPWGWSLGALLRHVSRWSLGESYDRETGLHHLAHAAWHCLTLYVFETHRLGKDTRKPEPSVIDRIQAAALEALDQAIDARNDEAIPFGLVTPAKPSADEVETVPRIVAADVCGEWYEHPVDDDVTPVSDSAIVAEEPTDAPERFCGAV